MSPPLPAAGATLPRQLEDAGSRDGDVLSSDPRAPAGAKADRRLPELDVLRGLAVAGMILVTSPGSWNDAYGPLKHADWQGATAADMVFPAFLVAVGVSIAISFERQWKDAPLSRILAKVGRRCMALIALGLVLNALPAFDLAHLRIPGILQRIALCYGLACVLTLATARSAGRGLRRTDPGSIAAAAILVLAVYWLVLAFAPVPGFASGRLDSYGSFPAWLDRTTFGTAHLWAYGTTPGLGVTFDPEGLASTLGALTDVLFGTLAGWRLMNGPTNRGTWTIALAAMLMIGAGLAIAPILPLIKKIWTPSFALFSGGVALFALAALRAALRSPVGTMLAWPMRVLGGNAILAFVISQLLGVFASLKFAGLPWATPQAFGFHAARALLPDPGAASLACAVAIMCLTIALLAPLQKRAIHLRL